MKFPFRITPLLFALVASASAEAELSAEQESVAKLQIALDASPYKPGKIDGIWGGFTEQALKIYLDEKDLGEVTFDGTNPEVLPTDLGLKDDAFKSYQITEKDLDMIGEIPGDGEVVAKSKLDSLPYSSISELIGEKFHVDLDFLATLNPDTDIDNLDAGSSVQVPDVDAPFEIGDVKSGGNDVEADSEDLRIEISTQTNHLRLFEKDKLIAVYPVSTGSDSTPAPEGDWEVTSVTFLPTFRWDKKMLEEGERSDEAHILPPGVNNPVGIVWMALNKEGIGIHGTEHPDTIGHADSHGCIRLSNWDAWSLGQKIPVGTKVKID